MSKKLLLELDIEVDGKISEERLREVLQMHFSEYGSIVSACIQEKAAYEVSKITDTLDLMRDEFRRIQARIVEEKGTDLAGVFSSIFQLCDRAVSGIEQQVPVIRQRDVAEQLARRLTKEKDDAEARVKELEGLKCRRVGIGLDGFYAAFVIETKVEPVVGVTTLGDAMPRKEGVIHGKTCFKAKHLDAAGYLHSESDDSPYSVDGATYCGRCHHFLTRKEVAP